MYFGSKNGKDYGFFCGIVTRVQTGSGESGIPVYEDKMTAPFDGAIQISDERYQELLEGQSLGKIIVPDESGNPVLTEPPDLPDPAAAAKDAMRALQQKITVMSIPLDDDETALAVAPVCPDWTPGEVYQAGEIVNHEEQAYRVIQTVTALENQPPGATGMLAIYRPLDNEGHTGRIDDPFPYVHGMDVSTGFFYSFNGKKYLANADMKPCVWDPGTPGVWQWEEVE